MFTAFLDACVLVPIAPCDTMLRMAEAGAFRPVWSEKVIDEAIKTLTEIHPDIDPSRFQSRFRSMNEAFDDALVTGWEPLVEALDLPDPKDHHVVAAAMRGRADVIVTNNIKDFPPDALEPLGLAAVTLDDFLLDQLDLGRNGTRGVITAQAADARNPPITTDELLASIARGGAPRFSAAVRVLLAEKPGSDAQPSTP